jgi:ABC-type transport system substrate-binding protein
LPKHIWGEIPFADWRTNPASTGEDPARVIGTGPFKFDSLDTSDNVVTLVKNPDHYGQVP